MASYKYLKKETVLEAIKNTYGITSTVAQRLGCDWSTAQRLINRWEETKAKWAEETERVLDLAESKVITAINNNDIATTKWYLSKKGKARGYEDVPTIELRNQEPLNIQFSEQSEIEMKEADNVEINNGQEEEAE